MERPGIVDGRARGRWSSRGWRVKYGFTERREESERDGEGVKCHRIVKGKV
jgi:hypothetical protein